MRQQVFDRNGYIALITVLIISIIGIAVAVALLLLSVVSMQTSLVTERSKYAHAITDACAEAALMQIKNSINFEGSNTVTFSKGSCTYTVTKQMGQARTIMSTGTVSTIIRKVKITLDKITPRINVTSWQEPADF